MRNNHVKKMREFIEARMSFGECIITHKDILRETNANCCYSVLKGLKKYYNIIWKEIKKENCNYRQYTVQRKEENNAQTPNIRRESENVQLSLIQLGKNPSQIIY